MGTLTIEHANAMPAPTWHRLKMNDADIELPAELSAAQKAEVSCEEGLRGEADAFDAALEAMDAGAFEGAINMRTADPLPVATSPITSAVTLPLHGRRRARG